MSHRGVITHVLPRVCVVRMIQHQVARAAANEKVVRATVNCCAHAAGSRFFSRHRNFFVDHFSLAPVPERNVMSHRNVKPHVSINEVTCNRTERALVGSADPLLRGVGAPHQCPRINNKTKWMRHHCHVLLQQRVVP